MKPKNTICLWFDKDAEEAARFYAATFPMLFNTWSGVRSVNPIWLRAAGAIPVGITNVPELTIFPWTASDANGITRNPWDLSRTPGGSSGGSASAVAAGSPKYSFLTW